eukprot:m.285243 g.285243  ORF g.285243 m.285243 type:complete len:64 (+) comp15772_c0_seq3:1867-2058(+)
MLPIDFDLLVCNIIDCLLLAPLTYLMILVHAKDLISLELSARIDAVDILLLLWLIVTLDLVQS